MNYTETDRRLHFLCQLVAKANSTYVEKKADDSHTNLFLDMLGRRIVGHWITDGENRMLASINIDTLDFEWLNENLTVLYRVETSERYVTEVEEEISQTIDKFGMNSAGYSADLHFDIPQYSFATEKYEALDQDSIAEWCAARELANELCSLVAGYWQADVKPRIWPHHFDTGIYHELTSKLGIGVGFAMEDEMVGSPYIYVSGYGLNGNTLSYNQFPSQEIGDWHVTENWKGYTIPIEEIYDEEGYPDHDQIEAMVQMAIDYYMNM